MDIVTLAMAKAFTVDYVQEHGSVKEIHEYSSSSGFPVIGESDSLYVALDTNKVYRWSGSVYIEVSPSTIEELAVAGNNGKIIEIQNGSFVAVLPESVFPNGDSVEY